MLLFRKFILLNVCHSSGWLRIYYAITNTMKEIESMLNKISVFKLYLNPSFFFLLDNFSFKNIFRILYAVDSAVENVRRRLILIRLSVNSVALSTGLLC